MARGTRRPFGVSFAAGWAAIGGALSILQAFGMGMAGVVLAGPSDSAALVAIAVSGLSALVGFGLLIVAGGLYKVRPWARTAGIVLFGLFALVNLYSLLDGAILQVIPLSLDGASLAFLVVNRDVFTSDRPDVSGRSAHRVGRN
jgi:hypothetical protein